MIGFLKFWITIAVLITTVGILIDLITVAGKTLMEEEVEGCRILGMFKSAVIMILGTLVLIGLKD